MRKVVVIGGGAAGLIAAVTAAENGAEVMVLEKMNRCGIKLSITGKGRCNITNAGDINTHIKNMPGNGVFLYKAFHQFHNKEIVEFMENNGVPTKVERGNRVFPVSDQAADVVHAFLRTLSVLNTKVLTGKAAKSIIVENKNIKSVKTMAEEFDADAIILATGGVSYPGTGSSGDGYEIARKLGHTIMPLKPSLVPLEVEEDWVSDLQGLALKNVLASVYCGDKKIAEEFGELLFTHFGLSGPIVLSLSKIVSEYFAKEEDTEIVIKINLKPALSPEVLDKRLQKDFTKHNRKVFKNALSDLLPAKLVNPIVDLSYIDPEKPVNQITKEERARVLTLLHGLEFTISRLRPISEAIVTAGGVSIKEINPGTMESKIIKGLYFAGEVIDIDGYTGGFNLQAAFSTGYVAGLHAARD